MLTDAELDELERLETAATSGEWRYWEDEDVRWDHPRTCGYDYRVNHACDPYYCTGPNCLTAEQANNDARLIVALRNAAPKLISDLRSARATITEMRGRLERALGSVDAVLHGAEVTGGRTEGEP